MSFSLAHYLHMCVFVSIHVIYIRVHIHIVLNICSGSSHASHVDTTIKFDWKKKYLECHPSSHCVSVSPLPVNTIQLPQTIWYHMVVNCHEHKL